MMLVGKAGFFFGGGVGGECLKVAKVVDRDVLKEI